MNSRKIAALAAALVLTTAGCAVGADDTDYSGGGTALEPRMGKARGKSAGTARDGSRDRAPGKDQRKERDQQEPAEDEQTDTSGQDQGSDDGVEQAAAPTQSPTAPGGQGGSGAQSGDASASVADSRGDASGVGAPAYVDLTGAQLTRTGSALTLTVTSAAAFPARQDGSRTTNVIGFFDVDGDGSTDYEVWGTLADDGWSPTWRHPDGARFGSDSGIGVSAAGNRVTFRFHARHVGEAGSFRWVVGAEDGTLEQVSTGTSARDYAPDSGAAAFPAR